MGAQCCGEGGSTSKETVTVDHKPSYVASNADEPEKKQEEELDEPMEEPQKSEQEEPRKSEDNTEFQFTIVLEKSSPSDKIGAKVGRKNQGLKILEVKDGIIGDHNKKHPESALKEGDFIVQANGEGGCETILQILGSIPVVELKIWRPPPAKEN